MEATTLKYYQVRLLEQPPLNTSVSVHAPTGIKIDNICIVGTGYVGGCTAAVIALHNPHIRVDVVGIDQGQVERWMSPHLPIHEPGLNDIVRVSRDGAWATTSPQQQSSGRRQGKVQRQTTTQFREPNLFFSTDVQGAIQRADAVFIAVNTPTKVSGDGAGDAPDMSAHDSVVKEIANHANPGVIIVEKSTVPCGTVGAVESTLRDLRPDVPFVVLSNPEFLAEGSAVEDLMKPDRIIIGSHDSSTARAAARALATIYETWVPRPRIIISDIPSSELTKLVSNAMLAQRVSSINSIGMLCDSVGADVDAVAKMVGMDSRIGSNFLRAGLGFGGSCLKKDLAALVHLATEHGLPYVAQYWNEVAAVNKYQPLQLIEKIGNCFGGVLTDRKIAVLGFAFKSDTGDFRESPMIGIIKQIRTGKPSQIAIYDPYCAGVDIIRALGLALEKDDGGVRICNDPYEACFSADAIIVGTECGRSVGSAGHDAALQTPKNSERGVIVSYKLAPEPACKLDQGLCPYCTSKANNADQRSTMIADWMSLDWRRLLKDMKRPRWIFDGRNTLDAEAFRGLGIAVTVEGVGKPAVELEDTRGVLR